MVTLTTVGYGNLVPTHTGTKLFVCFYLLVGLYVLAIGVGFATARIASASKDNKKSVATAFLRCS